MDSANIRDEQNRNASQNCYSGHCEDWRKGAQPRRHDGAKTNVISFRVAEMPKARGSPEVGVSAFSRDRRYPKAAPFTDPAIAANAISQPNATS